MPVTIYRSTDASAPVLNGQIGSLITVLDACLVNGYGSKSPAGWTKAFTAANIAVYRQPVGTNQFYLRVDDTGTTTARWLGYETMSDIVTGTSPFPTNGQVAGGLYTVKSSTADAVARPWMLVTNGKIVYLFTNTNSSPTFPLMSYLMFGDIVSYKPNDAFHTVAIGATGNTVVAASHLFPSLRPFISYGNTSGHFMARGFTGVGGSIGVGKVSNSACFGYHNQINSGEQYDFSMGNNCAISSLASSYSQMVYPNTSDGGLYLERAWITENGNSFRGELPGIWVPMHYRPVPNHGDVWQGAGQLAGKNFEAYFWTNSTVSGQFAIETSNTW